MERPVRHILLLLIFLIVFAAPLAAEEKLPLVSGPLNDITFTDDMWESTYLALEKIEPVYLDKGIVFDIPVPPANDSEETAQELKILFQYEKELRTPETVAEIKRDQYGPFRDLFGELTGTSEDIKAEVQTVKNRAVKDMDGFLYALKRQYKRARPTQLAPDLTTVIDIPKGPAYPSGHAAASQMAARVYSYIDPAHEADYLRFSEELSQRRAIAGIHYPSDCDAGRDLANQAFEKLLAAPGYRAELDAVKAMYNKSRTVAKEERDISNIKFTKEQWDPEIVDLANIKPKHLDPETELSVAPPPANDSEETARELTTLRNYKKGDLETTVIEKIEYEAQNGGRFDLGIKEAESLDEGLHDDITNLKLQALMEMTYFVFREKRRHARARPNQLDPSLVTIIETPGHPAYPSAHAAQSFITALVLGYIDPAHKDAYEQEARAIGHRRELARVHYPSDTEAGIELAVKMFALLVETPSFREQLDEVTAAYQAQMHLETE